MRLHVYVLLAKDLLVRDSYVKLQVGKQKSKTRILKNNTNPVWNEEFVFRVHNTDEDLLVSLFSHDDDFGLFSGSGDLVGWVRIPVWLVLAAHNQTLPPTWLTLEKPQTGKFINMDCETEGLLLSSHGMYCSKAPCLKMAQGKKLMKTIANCLERVFYKNEEASRIGNSSDSASASSDYEDCVEEYSCSCSFGEAMEIMKSSDNKQEMPENLHGVFLLDQIYEVTSYDLFAPDSQFRKDLAELQDTTDVEEESWTWKSVNMSHLARTVTYTKAATKLVKAVKATEEQTYLRADGRQFAVLVNVSTPDIVPGPEPSSGEESSRLIISWGIDFHQCTLMKGVIEGGVKQGLKESFDQFANLLAKNFKMLDSTESLKKDQVLTTLEAEHESDWELASECFWNFTVVSTIFMVFCVILHILLCEPSKAQGLELSGLDLPDSFGQLITCAILVIQLKLVCNMVSHFIQARFQRGSDHGIKAQGNGWILTVALIEGTNLASLDSTGFSDPYVVFTCNVLLVKLFWNYNAHALEFDAMEEPPSVLDVEVFDFDGPFDQSTSLGHAEINFLKCTSTELADMWISLEGKLAQSSQSKLHLRIFLDNNKGVETIKEYLTKMEKEVGKKLNLRSPHRNSTFQKLFGLPPEEFLISDFTCHLKRKMPSQDIEDIQVLPPSLSSVGSPTLVIVLRKGRGLDARHEAKAQDEEGRLGYYFQSFVSFNVASKTIMALWRRRTLTAEQKAQIAEEQQQDQEETPVILADSGSLLDVEEAKMSKVYSAEMPISHKIMERSGCLNYTTTNWECVKPGIFERRLSYRFNCHVSIFGGEVNFKYQIEQSALAHSACKCDVYVGTTWLKGTKFQQRITGNITEKFTHRLKEIFELLEREVLFAIQQDGVILENLVENVEVS
ncbi:hypothetical protein P3X46_023428 [Hevea brasiliensis]|uniref:C2 domain-containing protein n=1 Tax=Hevea brasiliensis TaxID=3981 RepID=A0ABQ9LEM0_HEVBR|nr:hypothetical protein P3X46_023428 [Hevea brasiliensis]